MKSEEQVYEAVMIGIRHNLDERKADLPKVFNYVRLHLMTLEFFDRVTAMT